MRISSLMMFNQFTMALQKNMADLYNEQNMLSSGKRINKPSDDVIGMSQAMDYKLSIANNTQFIRNIDNVTSQLGTTDTALQSVSDILTRAKELALQAANGSQTASDRAIISGEIKTMRDQLVGLGNTSVSGRYIFSGYQTNKKSFALNGSGEYVYQGDSNSFSVNIGTDATLKANVTGDIAFSDPAKVYSSVLGNTVGTGTLTFQVGSGNAVDIPVDSNNSSPEGIRDTVNAPMSKWYNSTDAVGTGTLILKAGSGAAVNLTVDASNNTPTQLRDAVNALGMGITAKVATDTVTGQQRLLFIPTTPGTSISIDAIDSDGNNTDASGLSALVSNPTTSNLTSNALGIDAAVLNGTAGKRLVFSPTTSGTSFTINVNDSDGNNTDASGLSLLYYNPPAGTNLNSSLSVLAVFDHLINSLTNNDIAGITASLNLITGAADQVLNVTADVGARLNQLTTERQNNDSRTLGLKTNLSATEDADIISTTSELQKSQVMMQALMQISAKVLPQSLLDFLK